ncbi:hypothetical protein IAT38_000895 [Cryptococcus sp. DSM 104549]
MAIGPFKHGAAWVAYKFSSSVLDDIWPGVLFFTGIATMVVCVSELTSVNLGINSVMLTVLGTIVSLVVSFKTNNSYSRWWDGRNQWSSLSTILRQLAMLIWVHVPNTLPPKPDEAKPADKPKEPPAHDTHTPGRPRSPVTRPSAATFATARTSFEDAEDGSEEGDEIAGGGWKQARAKEAKRMQEDEERLEKEEAADREAMQGLIEKKSYVGLVQAFAVAMKHALRGETGPFYSDLYSLIAFLPKYNPSAYPPITRDHLLALWHNGLPRQKYWAQDDAIAVPLTVPVAFRGDALNQPNLPDPFLDAEKAHGTQLFGPNPQEFKAQAIRSAASFVQTSDPDVFVVTNKREGRKSVQERRSIQVGRGGEGAEAGAGAGAGKGPATGEQVTLETVELMPPRHPPAPKFWDFFPPLRIFKVIYDKFNWQKKSKDSERRKGGKRKRMGTSMEIPQEIVMYLSCYISELIRRGLLHSSLITPCMTSILEMQRAISDLEKIATTPIPSAYTFHLRLTVYAYLFFIPFQVYNYIGWVAIPGTAIAAIIYLGFLEIGMQIEMPFYYDQSDLDLDEFVLRISHQIAQLTAFPTTTSASHVVLSHLNQPFLPTLRTSAPDLLGVPERQPRPSAKGCADAFATYDDKPHASGVPPTGSTAPPADAHSSASSSSSSSSASVSTPEAAKPKPLMKSMRDIELVLSANWRDVTSDAEDFIGKPRDQLENRTGLEVAVLKL